MHFSFEFDGKRNKLSVYDCMLLHNVYFTLEYDLLTIPMKLLYVWA